MSLRDELLRAGLVSKEKVTEVETSSRKRAHQIKKNKSLSAAEAKRQLEAKRQRQAAVEQQREQDRLLNLAREAEKKARALPAQIRQLIAEHRLNDPKAEIRYNFVAGGRFVRAVRVTPQQQNQLAKGLIGIAVNDEDEYDFPLIPREAAEKLAQLCADKILLLYPENDGSEEEDGER